MNEEEFEILTLDNGAEYAILDEFEYNGANYLFTVGVNENTNEVDLEDFLYFSQGFDQDGEFVEPLKDKKLFRELVLYQMTTELCEVPEYRKAFEDKLKEFGEL